MHCIGGGQSPHTEALLTTVLITISFVVSADYKISLCLRLKQALMSPSVALFLVSLVNLRCFMKWDE